MNTKRQGKAVSMQQRETIIHLYNSSFSQSEIARRLCLNKATVSNIINTFINENRLAPKTGGNYVRTARSENAITYIEYCKNQRPSTFAKEIQRDLVSNQVCLPETVPSCASISRASRYDLGYSYKRLHKIARESLTERTQERLMEYLAAIEDKGYRTLHFFDEASVIKTTGNRNYGHSAIGNEAYEIQRYASNATFTVNLLHGVIGITHVNILPGPSNGMELLNFFAEVLNNVDELGNPVLKVGDIVVMDNCGFHHAILTEQALRRMLGDHGVELVYQPPYHPMYNTCEMCFRFLKGWLRAHTEYAEKYTEIAILDALSYITPQISYNYFRKCGYVD